MATITSLKPITGTLKSCSPTARGQDTPGIHARHHLVEFRFLQLADDPLVRAVGLVRDDRLCRQVRIVERQLDLMDVAERLAGG